MHTPAEAANVLQIAAPTLRRWSSDLAALLSPQAKRPGAAGRRYTDDDLALLRRYQSLIRDNGLTYEQARARLLVEQQSAPQAQRVEVEVLQPSDQAHALSAFVEAQRALIESQRQNIAQQQEQITGLITQLEQQREQTEGDRASLLAQMKQQRDQADSDRERLQAQLDQAKQDEAAALASLRQMLDKIPRWLRGWLGLGA